MQSIHLRPRKVYCPAGAGEKAETLNHAAVQQTTCGHILDAPAFAQLRPGRLAGSVKAEKLKAESGKLNASERGQRMSLKTEDRGQRSEVREEEPASAPRFSECGMEAFEAGFGP
jgi:hypothetical protein